MVITDLLERNAKLYGNETALVEINPELQEKQRKTWREYALVEAAPTVRYRKQMTWKEFDRKANRFANLLIENGVRKGDKVAILLMNCLEWLPIYFGILKAGALAVPLNYRYTAEEIKYCLDLSESTSLIFGPEFSARVESILDRIPAVKRLYYVGADCPTFSDSYYMLMADTPYDKPEMSLTPEDNAAIYFSSGTTGFPKAILHNHQSLFSACEAEQAHHGQQRGDNFLCMPPLYHTGAKMHWFGSLISGSKAVLLRGISPKWILETVSEEHITIVWLLVPWAQDILDAIDRKELNLSDYNLDQWRLMHIGAQPVPPSLVKRWKRYFPNHQYDTNYGLTESIGPGCVHLGVENIEKVGAIGKAGYNWEAKVAGDDGRALGQGEVGELWVRGPGLMTCYYRDPKATAAVLTPDGWLKTGDVAMADEDGFIFLVDRKKDVIICGGENLYPVQIEDFLRANNLIKDVAVIGLPHSRLGEIPVAIVELKPDMDASEAEILEYCKGLPRYKRPHRIIFDKVPRNPTGKIEKPKLREKYVQGTLVEAQTKG